MTTPAYAEEAVLGGILVRNESFHEAGQWLTEEHFTSAFRKRLWAAIRERILAGEPADAVTMLEALPDDADAIWELIHSARRPARSGCTSRSSGRTGGCDSRRTSRQTSCRQRAAARMPWTRQSVPCFGSTPR